MDGAESLVFLALIIAVAEILIEKSSMQCDKRVYHLKRGLLKGDLGKSD